MVSGCFGWFRVVLGGFRWFWVVCCFSSYESKHGQIPNFVLRGLRKRWHSSMKEACPNDEPYFHFAITLRDRLLKTSHLLLIRKEVNSGMAYQMQPIWQPVDGGYASTLGAFVN